MFESDLDTMQDGLYWIYTSYTNSELLNSRPSQKPGSIDFADRVATHRDLQHICTRTVDGFNLVYNGIGGVGPKGSGGLRERILQEYRGGDGTGSLAINDSSLCDLEKWRVSYVLWSEIEFNTPQRYQDFGKTVERLWRLHFGWPILCNK